MMASPPARLLIVDDDVSILQTLSALLKDDYHVSVAKSATLALKQIQSQQPPNLILMDVMMPQISGIEMCRQLQADPQTRDIPVIFITSLSTAQDESEALEAGAVDFITKPISPANVRLRVGLHIQLQQQRAALAEKNQSLESEREQISQILEKMHSRYTPDTSRLTYVSESVERNSGDIVLALNTPRGYYCLVGDFTGHGLPAAVGGPALARVFMDSIQRACFSPSQLLQQLNYELFCLLPANVFLCAVFVYLDPLSRTASVWNAGLPPQFILGNGITPIESTSPPLGISIETTPLTPSVQLSLNREQQLFLYTDGLAEITPPDSVEMFGEERIKTWLNEHDTHTERHLNDLLSQALDYRNGPIDDDITLACLSLEPLGRVSPRL